MDDQEVMDIYADLNRKYIERGDRIAELTAMLHKSWSAVQEAGYEGYDEQLREFMGVLD